MVENFQEMFLYFPFIFSVFIVHSFYVSHSGLIELTNSFSFCKIFQAPPKYFNMQKLKHAQNSMELS